MFLKDYKDYHEKLRQLRQQKQFESLLSINKLKCATKTIIDHIHLSNDYLFGQINQITNENSL
jgi:hypothetical protein